MFGTDHLEECCKIFRLLVGYEVYDVGHDGEMPALRMRHKETGETKDVFVSQDPEGNGPGFLFVEGGDNDEITFDEWRDLGFDVGSMQTAGVAEFIDNDEDARGRIYPDGAWIALAETLEEDGHMHYHYWTMINRSYYKSRKLKDVEKPLYKFWREELSNGRPKV